MSESRQKRKRKPHSRDVCEETSRAPGQNSAHRTTVTTRKEPVTRASWYESKRPVLRFVALFAVYCAVLYGLYLSLSQTSAFGSYLGLLASACAGILRLLGCIASVDGPLLFSEEFSMNVAASCDGMQSAALLAAATLASPVTLTSRVLFILVGVSALMMINFLRLVILFLVGVQFPRVFDILHGEAWPALIITFVLVCWLIWVRWAVQNRGMPHRASK